jgi:LPS export ABC transporter ATP-binding protein
MYQRARLGVGYLPQEASIFRGMTVEENVLAVAELVEKDRAARMAQVDSLLSELHVEHLRHQAATSLSGGERRRVEIARALASRPSFMLLDEPFTGIDPLAISDISDLVRYLKQRGLGVLITDHQVRETLQIVDRAYVMYDGEVLFNGSPDLVLNNEDVRRVYLGEQFCRLKGARLMSMKQRLDHAPEPVPGDDAATAAGDQAAAAFQSSNLPNSSKQRSSATRCLQKAEDNDEAPPKAASRPAAKSLSLDDRFRHGRGARTAGCPG